MPDTIAKHCLSFDVEEHFQVSAFESPMRRRHWDQYESRVEANTEKLLELLGNRQIRATFFVLGWVAERYSSLVRQIASAGHEVASHGYAHELITAQTPAAFRDDIRKAKGILESILSQPVLGYRAPSFSITKDTMWATQILVEEGYVYDSSIFPVVHDRYGVPSANPDVHQLSTASGLLWEVPPSTVKCLGVRVPVAGGGYFRLYPYPLLRTLLRKLERKGSPLVMYMHPWEFDPKQPRMEGSILSRLRHYMNLDKTEFRLRALLQDFAFSPIREVFPQIAQYHGIQMKASMKVEGTFPPVSPSDVLLN
ncbi:XrtA system polysaccharide deacetylase [Nitrospira defluvii]|uniref:Polysaccharide deacetylase family protein n=1 Tax=Nitrospira defluvii TaxID=330214 RepID=A0ABM8RDF9_9BACT|nr:XrtA system polysaccharide deacetylase [Nitrospira defluvii]CAE6746999.1 Polysaccharide deacetylase family protein [Nitrospira defluvii]